MFRTLALAACLCMPITAFAAEAIGKVVALAGSPIAENAEGNRKLQVGSDVFEADTIVVKKGNAQLILADDTRLVVGPDSRLELAAFVKDDSGAASRIAVKALRGTFRFITGKSPKQAFSIQTAHATIGIRGTGFDYWVKKATGVVVLDGQVELCAGRDPENCVQLDDQCGAGRATALTATEPLGVQAAQLIRDNLPFIENQSMLRKDFRLATRRCDKVLATVPKRKKK